MLLSYMNNCKKPSRKHKCSPCLRLGDKSNTMTERLMLYCLSQVTWSWLKLMSTRGRGKWRTCGRRNHTKWNAELLMASLGTSWRTRGQDAHESSTKTDFFSSLLQCTPLWMVVWAEWAQCATTTLEEQTADRSETEEVPQSVECLLLAQQQTVKTPPGWVNRKLCAVLWMFARVSTLDQGWKVQCRGTRGVRESMLALWWQRYWSHQWGL